MYVKGFMIMNGKLAKMRVADVAPISFSLSSASLNLINAGISRRTGKPLPSVAKPSSIPQGMALFLTIM